MKQITWVIAGLTVVAGCQRSGRSTVSETYRGDIERLCDVVARSGADQLPPGERTLAIANWLAGNLETREAHDYLVRIQPLAGEPKAAALETEARRVGLARCALAAEWRGAPSEAGSM